MATNTRITELDFDQIKDNLKDFMRTQDGFSDFDYEGSGLSVLLNVLALNTHYNAYLANASFNEAFLDSAVKRGNAVSRARELGYTARSARSAVATVDIDVVNPQYMSSVVTLDRYTPFTTTIDGGSFTFYNIDAITAPLSSNAYEFAGVKLFEGRLIQNSFMFDGSTNVFEIPNVDVDLTTLTVQVQRSSVDTFVEPYNFTSEVVGVTGESAVFFVQENSREKYEIYFGDGVLGKSLTVGNIITMTYLVSSKDAANVSSSKFAQKFTMAGSISGNTNVLINVVQNSVGGRDKEDIESIKFNAPLALSRAKRLITAEDYLSAISEMSSVVESVSVWGGEEMTPKQYGRVFLSLKPYEGYVISENVKADIKADILDRQGNMLVTPVFVDPEYIYVSMEVTSTYNPDRTTVSAEDIKGYITNNIVDYFNKTLNKFKKKFVFSQLSRMIDDTNDSLIGNLITMKLQKRVPFTYYFPTTIDVSYDIALAPGSLASNIFTYSTNDVVDALSVLVDDGKGNVSVQDVNTGSTLALNVGTVNYATGKVLIKDFIITGLVGGVEDIRMTFAPARAMTDVDTNRNQIIQLDDSTEVPVANIKPGLQVFVAAK